MSRMSRHTLNTRPELWAGIECTVNRVGDRYLDQLERSGHSARPADLELFAELGARAARYPVLWERTAPDSIEQCDWSWADERLERLRRLGVRPVVGLTHHGSGPRYTSLVDPEFPEKLARFARAVAERYPWVEDYTPVNEPLTTARFSGLYGHWYPHGRDDLTFARCLLNQCRAVALSMRAVREVNSRARLVQTEDLGKTYGTPALAYQAEFENERRWLTFDLLTGRVRRGHAMWRYFRHVGVGQAELEWFAENPCPPDAVGINHYLTSERFLDQRLKRYPPATHGGNGRHAYADVEAVRVLAEGIAGPRVLLREAWERYELPVAVTETHLGCTRDEQLRWFKHVWDAACELRAGGADVRAVTAWALLGSFDWDSLATCARGHYEPGAFDVRAPRRPRPTALARMMKSLGRGEDFTHPVLASPGWWQRPARLLYPPVNARADREFEKKSDQAMTGAGADLRPILVTGATGTLGQAFARACEGRALGYRLLTRRELDIADEASVAAALDGLNPWAVVNAAGFVRVDDAECERAACFRENAEGAATLASGCAARGVKLLTFSSDLVFDGTKRDAPYVESDATAPLGAYGESKAEAERRVLELARDALIIRTSAFFGPWDKYNFVTLALRALSEGREFVAASDAVVSPTYVPDLTHACLDLLIDGEAGLWHLANDGAVTWAELARRAAALAGLDERLVVGRPVASLNLAAPRPLHCAIASERGALLPPLDDALARYLRERVRPGAEGADEPPQAAARVKAKAAIAALKV